jgi:hypothetical protein
MAVYESISRFLLLLDFGAEVVYKLENIYHPNLRERCVPNGEHVTQNLVLIFSLHIIFIETYAVQLTLVQLILFICEY